MSRISTLTILGVLLLPQFLFGEEPPQIQPIKVAISVSGPDALKASIRNHVMRELDAQKDIVVTEVDPHWILQIVALDQECPTGGEPTVMTSALVLEPFSNAPLLVFLSEELDTRTLTAIQRLTYGLFRYSRHWIETAPVSDLPGLSGSIVSRFWSLVQEKGRKGVESAPRQ
ncbi:MAG: hypothetical protein GTO12_15290 [Proteobacteria bacterium]|nr:hypothetical protein [Pseudomonadota bacterium]